MKITTLVVLLFVLFVPVSGFAGGKGKSAPSSNDPAPLPTLPVVVVAEEECVDIEEPARIIPSMQYSGGIGVGFMTCEGLIISAPAQSGFSSMVGTKMSRHCVKKGGK